MSGLLAIALLIIMVLGTIVMHLWNILKYRKMVFNSFSEEIEDLKDKVKNAHIVINKLKIRIHEYESKKSKG